MNKESIVKAKLRSGVLWTSTPVIHFPANLSRAHRNKQTVMAYWSTFCRTLYFLPDLKRQLPRERSKRCNCWTSGWRDLPPSWCQFDLEHPVSAMQLPKLQRDLVWWSHVGGRFFSAECIGWEQKYDRDQCQQWSRWHHAPRLVDKLIQAFETKTKASWYFSKREKGDQAFMSNQCSTDGVVKGDKIMMVTLHKRWSTTSMTLIWPEWYHQKLRQGRDPVKRADSARFRSWHSIHRWSD